MGENPKPRSGQSAPAISSGFPSLASSDVRNSGYNNLALVLVGHGSSANSGSGLPVLQHSEELRKRGLFAEVHPAYWKQEPRIETVLQRVTSRFVLVVPLFVSAGFFSENIVPAALGLDILEDTPGRRVRMLDASGRALAYCRPVGTHPHMTNVLLARASEVITKHPFPRAPQPRDISLFIAGHGTPQDTNSRVAIEDHVQLLGSKNVYASVQAVYIEEAPRIAECFQLAVTLNIVMVPFFISEGMHTSEDLPILLGERADLVRQRIAVGQPTWMNPTEKRRKRIWLSAPAGTHPDLANVILDRAAEGAEWLKLQTANSNAPTTQISDTHSPHS